MKKWEYLFVMASAGRPAIVNGQELRDWESGPTIDEFSNQLGEQGWELVAIDSNATVLSFKRPKAQPRRGQQTREA